MKKLFVFILMLLFIAGPAVSVFAQKSTSSSDASSVPGDVAAYRLQVGEKAARGTGNLLFGWTEIPKRVVDITKETNNPIWGAVAGTFQGTLKAIARTASGASDIVTAPVSPQKDPLIQPDINVE